MELHFYFLGEASTYYDYSSAISEYRSEWAHLCLIHEGTHLLLQPKSLAANPGLNLISQEPIVAECLKFVPAAFPTCAI